MATGRECSICASSNRAAIDTELAKGTDDLEIAQRFAVTLARLGRHRPHAESKKQKHAPRSGSTSHRTAAQPESSRQLEGDVVPLRGACPACPICDHEKRAEIEAAVRAGGAASTIARRFLVAAPALRAHLAEHVAAAKADVDELPETVEALEHARDALRRAHELRREVATDGSLHERSVAEREVRAAIKLVSDVEHARDISEAVILRSPAWARVEAAIVAALADFPDAARAVAAAVEQLDRAPRAQEAA